jgi:hypothetical protein
MVFVSAFASDTPDKPAEAKTNPAAPAKAAAAGPLQEWFPGWLQIGAQVRGRLDGPTGLGYTPGVSNDYYLERVRLDILVRPIAQLRFYAQTQDSRAWGYDNRAALNSVHDPLDFRQGYVDFLSNESRGVQVRFGRQDITLGAGRLVSSPDWSNVSRSFDAARLALFRPGIRMDFIAGSPVLIDPGRMDRHKPGEHLYASYVSLTKLVPRANLQPYLLARTTLNAAPESGKAGDARLYTAGVRLEGKLPARFDYAVEVAKQWGPWSSDRISAVGGMYTLGWVVRPTGLKPRLTLDAHHASGDGDAKDGTHGTFDQMYAANHNTMGITDQFGWKNMRMAKAGVEFSPCKKCKVGTDFREMYLATIQDGLYAGNGTRSVLNRKATSRHVGSEADVTAFYQFNKVWSAGIGVGRVFAGAYLAQSSKGGDYTYPFLTWTGRF